MKSYQKCVWYFYLVSSLLQWNMLVNLYMCISIYFQLSFIYFLIHFFENVLLFHTKNVYSTFNSITVKYASESYQKCVWYFYFLIIFLEFLVNKAVWVEAGVSWTLLMQDFLRFHTKNVYSPFNSYYSEICKWIIPKMCMVLLFLKAVGRGRSKLDSLNVGFS